MNAQFWQPLTARAKAHLHLMQTVASLNPKREVDRVYLPVSEYERLKAALEAAQTTTPVAPSDSVQSLNAPSGWKCIEAGAEIH